MIHFVRPDADVPEIVEQARSDGHAVFVVDAAGDLKGSIAQFAEVLRLPEWFGQNLDALADALHEFRASAPEPTTLVWDRIRTLRRTSPQDYECLLAVLDDVQSEREDLTVQVVQR